MTMGIVDAGVPDGNPGPADFAGTMIRFAFAAAPASPTEGTFLCDCPANPGSSDSFIDSNLPVGLVFYSAFAYDRGIPSYAAPISASIWIFGPGDFDGDGDVDQVDFGHLQTCFSGPFVPQTNVNCRDAMLDYDNDVDNEDFAIFQACFSGSDVPADPSCAD